ncbi:MAG: 2Fe-2S iron-sulfur cluster binding domain-containing protein, partial [Spirochaetaceae bacterium]|nr:2Fe-2S iron-sulfur cluster binding domain-containing protein [Spirochaetaceae bacterium]
MPFERDRRRQLVAFAAVWHNSRQAVGLEGGVVAVVRVTRAEYGEREIEAGHGRSLLAALHDAGIYIPAVCGGRGSCGKCRIRAHDGFLPVNFSDKEFFSQEQLEAGYRLACAVFPDGDIGIEVFETGEDRFSVVNDFRRDEEAAAGIVEDFFYLEKDGRSLARRLAPDRTLSYAELREASKLADAQAALLQGEQRKFSVYREQGRILSIGAEPPYAVAVDIGTTTLA